MKSEGKGCSMVKGFFTKNNTERQTVMVGGWMFDCFGNVRQDRATPGEGVGIMKACVKRTSCSDSTADLTPRDSCIIHPYTYL